MIGLDTLRHLAAQKTKDAEVLLRHQRSGGAIYMMGYALEFMLKRKIGLTLGFINGFPETASELTSYSAQIAHFHTLSTGIQLTQIRQIRNHKLNDLLVFSGVQGKIITRFYGQWQTVSCWNPENRYARQRLTREKAAAFLRNAKKILREIS